MSSFADTLVEKWNREIVTYMYENLPFYMLCLAMQKRMIM